MWVELGRQLHEQGSASHSVFSAFLSQTTCTMLGNSISAAEGSQNFLCYLLLERGRFQAGITPQEARGNACSMAEDFLPFVSLQAQAAAVGSIKVSQIQKMHFGTENETPQSQTWRELPGVESQSPCQ